MQDPEPFIPDSERKPGGADEPVPAMFSVFDDAPLDTTGFAPGTTGCATLDGEQPRFDPAIIFSPKEQGEFPEYFPAEPFTVVTAAPADEKSGHEFVLHNNREEERYYVFFFARKQDADDLRDAFTAATGQAAQVVRFEPQAIEDRMGVRYTDDRGKQTDMSIQDYRRNMEIKNKFRRDD